MEDTNARFYPEGSLTFIQSRHSSPSLTPSEMSDLPYEANRNSRYSFFSTVTDDASLSDKIDTTDLMLSDDELEASSPDPLHSVDPPYPRHGPARYIYETDKTLTFFSLRGFLNMSALAIILGALLFTFIGLPIWKYSHPDPTLEYPNPQDSLLMPQGGQP
ncbi:hypothetical protein O181_014538 [Austropuccinia psidii MF-1]|uniref:Uncharacterized protein n=1 Tax=Austropuccinia psidii MF-1 TaxID=1389203 RepID=A0A9Q3C1F3_9BASI|nr:hypothetical protein [Austropuccinia psidii MF-1]